MSRICSKHGPRYPVYNDKRSRYDGGQWYFYNNLALALIKDINPPLPRPTYQPAYTIKQPKASMGFVHGNRMIKKEGQNAIKKDRS